MLFNQPQFLFAMQPAAPIDALVIGGGFFGSRVALALRARGSAVMLVDKEAGLLRRASYNNQARVHSGYHYPRSVLTALRSRVNFPRFIDEYRDCLDEGFEQIYAVARTGSKVSARQFVDFCRRVGAPIEPATREVRSLFNPDLIEDVFRVREVAFDADRIAARLRHDLAAAGVEVRLGCRVERLAGDTAGLHVDLAGPDGARERLGATRVFNCTYSMLNQVLVASGLRPLKLKHELAELALVEVPEPLRRVGVTVMDGPFFSMMPFPARGLHTLTHVRYTPHHAWHDRADGWIDPHEHVARVAKRSHFVAMRQDARRYLPALADCRHAGSLWEVKTILPASETDDSRPILFSRDHGLTGLTCILGGKIDNIYDVLQEIEPAA